MAAICIAAALALNSCDPVALIVKDNSALEKITLKERAPFFEEVFNLHPVIRQKK